MMECSFNLFMQYGFVERAKDVNGIKISPVCSREILPGTSRSWKKYFFGPILVFMLHIKHSTSYCRAWSFFHLQPLWQRLSHFKVSLCEFSSGNLCSEFRNYSCWHCFSGICEKHSTIIMFLTYIHIFSDGSQPDFNSGWQNTASLW